MRFVSSRIRISNDAHYSRGGILINHVFRRLVFKQFLQPCTQSINANVHWSKAKGNISFIESVFISPSLVAIWTNVSLLANSKIRCRQPPQGEQKCSLGLAIRISFTCLAPPATIAANALPSAHWPSGKETFSTLQPV